LSHVPVNCINIIFYYSIFFSFSSRNISGICTQKQRRPLGQLCSFHCKLVQQSLRPKGIKPGIDIMIFYITINIRSERSYSVVCGGCSIQCWNLIFSLDPVPPFPYYSNAYYFNYINLILNLFFINVSQYFQEAAKIVKNRTELLVSLRSQEGKTGCLSFLYSSGY